MRRSDLSKPERALADALVEAFKQAVADGLEWVELEKLLRDTVEPHLARSFARGSKRGVKTLPTDEVVKAEDSIGYKLSFDQADPQAERWARTHGGELVTGVTEQSRRGVRDVVAEAQMEGGEAPRDQAKKIKAITGLDERRARAVDNLHRSMLAGGASDDAADAAMRRYADKALRQRAMTIARTETLKAQNEGQIATWGRAEDEGLIEKDAFVRSYIVAYDERTCPVCAPLDGLTAPIDSKDLRPPIHVMCFPAGIEVSGPRAVGATARHYTGELVEVVAGGHTLTGTPNHPVLTARGWVPLGELGEGDHLVRGRDREDSIDDLDEQQSPALIEDVASAFLEVDVPHTSVPTTAADFHGDGAGSDVAVVGSDRLLRSDREASVQQVDELAVQERLLGASALSSLRVLAACLPALCRAAKSFVRGFSQRLPTTLVQVAHALVHRFGATTWRDAGSLECATHQRTGDAQALRQRELTLTGGVATNELVSASGQRFLITLDLAPALALSRFLTEVVATSFFEPERDSLTAIPDGDVAIEDRFADDLVADAQAFSDQGHGPSGSVTFHDVVSVKRFAWSGHVYNLETERGWYLAEGFIVHNCRCTSELIPASEADDTERMERLRERFWDQAGWDAGEMDLYQERFLNRVVRMGTTGAVGTTGLIAGKKLLLDRFNFGAAKRIAAARAKQMWKHWRQRKYRDLGTIYRRYENAIQGEKDELAAKRYEKAAALREEMREYDRVIAADMRADVRDIGARVGATEAPPRPNQQWVKEWLNRTFNEPDGELAPLKYAEYVKQTVDRWNKRELAPDRVSLRRAWESARVGVNLYDDLTRSVWTMRELVHSAPELSYSLYKGVALGSYLGGLVSGDEVELPLTAFTSDQRGALGEMMVEVEPGAQALRTQLFAQTSEQRSRREHVTEGRFKVTFAEPGRVRLRQLPALDAPLHTEPGARESRHVPDERRAIYEKVIEVLERVVGFGRFSATKTADARKEIDQVLTAAELDKYRTLVHTAKKRHGPSGMWGDYKTTAQIFYDALERKTIDEVRWDAEDYEEMLYVVEWAQTQSRPAPKLQRGEGRRESLEELKRIYAPGKLVARPVSGFSINRRTAESFGGGGTHVIITVREGGLAAPLGALTGGFESEQEWWLYGVLKVHSAEMKGRFFEVDAEFVGHQTDRRGYPRRRLAMDRPQTLEDWERLLLPISDKLTYDDPAKALAPRTEQVVPDLELTDLVEGETALTRFAELRGHVLSASLESTGIEEAELITNTLLRELARADRLLQVLDKVRVSDLGRGVYAAYVDEDTSITMSTSNFSDGKLDKMRERLESDQKANFHPAGASEPQDVIRHELGHGVDKLLRDTGWKETLNQVINVYAERSPNRAMLQTLLDRTEVAEGQAVAAAISGRGVPGSKEAARALKGMADRKELVGPEGLESLKRRVGSLAVALELSRYAEENRGELLAEAWSSFRSGSDLAPESARVVGGAMDALLREEPIPEVDLLIWTADQFESREHNLAGVHKKEVLVAPDGSKWLFKPQVREPFRAQVDVATNRLMRLFGLRAPDTFEFEWEGKFGSLQRMFGDTRHDVDNEPFAGREPSQLTANELLQVERQAMVDWIMSNWDSHATNFVKVPEAFGDEVLGIDKGQAWKFLGQRGDSLTPWWSYPLEKPLWTKVMEAYVASPNSVKVARTEQHADFMFALERVPDADVRAAMAEVAAAHPKGEAIVDAVLERKNDIVNQWKQLRQELADAARKQPTGSAPAKPAVTLSPQKVLDHDPDAPVHLKAVKELLDEGKIAHPKQALKPDATNYNPDWLSATKAQKSVLWDFVKQQQAASPTKSVEQALKAVQAQAHTKKQPKPKDFSPMKAKASAPQPAGGKSVGMKIAEEVAQLPPVAQGLLALGTTPGTLGHALTMTIEELDANFALSQAEVTLIDTATPSELSSLKTLLTGLVTANEQLTAHKVAVASLAHSQLSTPITKQSLLVVVVKEAVLAQDFHLFKQGIATDFELKESLGMSLPELTGAGISTLVDLVHDELGGDLLNFKSNTWLSDALELYVQPQDVVGLVQAQTAQTTTQTGDIMMQEDIPSLPATTADTAVLLIEQLADIQLGQFKVLLEAVLDLPEESVSTVEDLADTLSIADPAVIQLVDDVTEHFASMDALEALFDDLKTIKVVPAPGTAEHPGAWPKLAEYTDVTGMDEEQLATHIATGAMQAANAAISPATMSQELLLAQLQDVLGDIEETMKSPLTAIEDAEWADAVVAVVENAKQGFGEDTKGAISLLVEGLKLGFTAPAATPATAPVTPLSQHPTLSQTAMLHGLTEPEVAAQVDEVLEWLDVDPPDMLDALATVLADLESGALSTTLVTSTLSQLAPPKGSPWAKPLYTLKTQFNVTTKEAVQLAVEVLEGSYLSQTELLAEKVAGMLPTTKNQVIALLQEVVGYGAVSVQAAATQLGVTNMYTIEQAKTIESKVGHEGMVQVLEALNAYVPSPPTAPPAQAPAPDVTAAHKQSVAAKAYAQSDEVSSLVSEHVLAEAMVNEKWLKQEIGDLPFGGPNKLNDQLYNATANKLSQMLQVSVDEAKDLLNFINAHVYWLVPPDNWLSAAVKSKFVDKPAPAPFPTYSGNVKTKGTVVQQLQDQLDAEQLENLDTAISKFWYEPGQLELGEGELLDVVSNILAIDIESLAATQLAEFMDAVGQALTQKQGHAPSPATTVPTTGGGTHTKESLKQTPLQHWDPTDIKNLQATLQSFIELGDLEGLPAKQAALLPIVKATTHVEVESLTAPELALFKQAVDELVQAKPKPKPLAQQFAEQLQVALSEPQQLAFVELAGAVANYFLETGDEALGADLAPGITDEQAVIDWVDEAIAALGDVDTLLAVTEQVLAGLEATASPPVPKDFTAQQVVEQLQDKGVTAAATLKAMHSGVHKLLKGGQEGEPTLMEQAALKKLAEATGIDVHMIASKKLSLIKSALEQLTDPTGGAQAWLETKFATAEHALELLAPLKHAVQGKEQTGGPFWTWLVDALQVHQVDVQVETLLHQFGGEVVPEWTSFEAAQLLVQAGEELGWLAAPGPSQPPTLEWVVSDFQGWPTENFNAVVGALEQLASGTPWHNLSDLHVEALSDFEAEYDITADDLSSTEAQELLDALQPTVFTPTVVPTKEGGLQQVFTVAQKLKQAWTVDELEELWDALDVWTSGGDMEAYESVFDKAVAATQTAMWTLDQGQATALAQALGQAINEKKALAPTGVTPEAAEQTAAMLNEEFGTSLFAIAPADGTIYLAEEAVGTFTPDDEVLWFDWVTTKTLEDTIDALDPAPGEAPTPDAEVTQAMVTWLQEETTQANWEDVLYTLQSYLQTGKTPSAWAMDVWGEQVAVDEWSAFIHGAQDVAANFEGADWKQALAAALQQLADRTPAPGGAGVSHLPPKPGTPGVSVAVAANAVSAWEPELLSDLVAALQHIAENEGSFAGLTDQQLNLLEALEDEVDVATTALTAAHAQALADAVQAELPVVQAEAAPYEQAKQKLKDWLLTLEHVQYTWAEMAQHVENWASQSGQDELHWAMGEFGDEDEAEGFANWIAEAFGQLVGTNVWNWEQALVDALKELAAEQRGMAAAPAPGVAGLDEWDRLQLKTLLEVLEGEWAGRSVEAVAGELRLTPMAAVVRVARELVDVERDRYVVPHLEGLLPQEFGLTPADVVARARARFSDELMTDVATIFGNLEHNTLRVAAAEGGVGDPETIELAHALLSMGEWSALAQELLDRLGFVPVSVPDVPLSPEGWELAERVAELGVWQRVELLDLLHGTVSEEAEVTAGAWELYRLADEADALDELRGWLTLPPFWSDTSVVEAALDKTWGHEFTAEVASWVHSGGEPDDPLLAAAVDRVYRALSEKERERFASRRRKRGPDPTPQADPLQVASGTLDTVPHWAAEEVLDALALLRDEGVALEETLADRPEALLNIATSVLETVGDRLNELLEEWGR